MDKILIRVGAVVMSASIVGMLAMCLTPQPSPQIMYFCMGAVVGLIICFIGSEPWRQDSLM